MKMVHVFRSALSFPKQHEEILLSKHSKRFLTTRQFWKTNPIFNVQIIISIKILQPTNLEIKSMHFYGGGEKDNTIGQISSHHR